MPSTQERNHEARLIYFEARRDKDRKTIALTLNQGVSILSSYPNRKFPVEKDYMDILDTERGFMPGDLCTLKSAGYLNYSGKRVKLDIEDFEILGRPQTLPLN